MLSRFVLWCKHKPVEVVSAKVDENNLDAAMDVLQFLMDYNLFIKYNHLYHKHIYVFYNSAGLCGNLNNHAQLLMFSSDYAAFLKECFKINNLSTSFPFGRSAYYKDLSKDSMHLCKKRVAFAKGLEKALLRNINAYLKSEGV